MAEVFKEEHLKVYYNVLANKLEKLIYLINEYECVKRASLVNKKIKVEFIEPVNIDEQEILNTFLYGGAIEKEQKNDDGETEYFYIEGLLGML